MLALSFHSTIPFFHYSRPFPARNSSRKAFKMSHLQYPHSVTTSRVSNLFIRRNVVTHFQRDLRKFRRVEPAYARNRDLAWAVLNLLFLDRSSSCPTSLMYCPNFFYKHSQLLCLYDQCHNLFQLDIHLAKPATSSAYVQAFRQAQRVALTSARLDLKLRHPSFLAPLSSKTRVQVRSLVSFSINITDDYQLQLSRTM